MTCDEVREQLAEHLLGTLDEAADVAVRRHLRGCAGCRAESVALSEGVSTFARAAHDLEPPEQLRDRVLAILEDEWAEAAPPPERARRAIRLTRAATAVALVAALGWGTFSSVRASRFEAAAERYETFLGVLGGQDIRVGELRAEGPQELRGSAVIYDSKVGQSWVLVLFRAPGWEGTVNVTLVSDDDARIDLHPMEVGPGGDASTWLVTSSDLRGFDRVNVWDESGLIASGSVERA